MHGFIFLQLKKYVQEKYGLDEWHELVQKANVSQPQFSATEIYPDQDIKALLQTASGRWNVSPNVLLEELGKFLVPDLLDIYQIYINPTWRTLDLIAHTEETMHKAVRVSSPAATPPVLHVTRIGKSKVIIDYHSHRKMAWLAVGIIKGIAKYYHESNQIEIQMKEYSEGNRIQLDVHYSA